MRVRVYGDHQIPSELRTDVARYRHRVFIERLKWNLPVLDGLEQDEFDVSEAVHIVAHTPKNEVIGYARLLPTTSPYLLATHFLKLLGDVDAPSNTRVWELSRYTANQTSVGKSVLLEAARHVMLCGGLQMIFCTTASVERLAKKWGVDIERLGRGSGYTDRNLIAARIHCNASTFDALTERV